MVGWLRTLSIHRGLVLSIHKGYDVRYLTEAVGGGGVVVTTTCRRPKAAGSLRSSGPARVRRCWAYR
jgi:hypothetical protein